MTKSKSANDNMMTRSV